MQNQMENLKQTLARGPQQRIVSGGSAALSRAQNQKVPPLTDPKAKREKSPAAKNPSARGQHRRGGAKAGEIVRRRLSRGLGTSPSPGRGQTAGSGNGRTTSRENTNVSPGVIERDMPNSIHKSKISSN